MSRTPRFRVGVLLVAIASLVIGPSSPADAQVPEEVEVEAVVFANTASNAFPQEHTLGLNRVSGPSRFRDFQFDAVVVCSEAPPAPAVSLVALTTDHPVTFWADDDITDGYGEISPTDTGREFEGTDVLGGDAVRARIEEGRFHRLLGVLEVDLTLDVRVTGPAGDQICHDPRLPLTIIFQPPGGAGFTVVGVGRRHHTVAGVDDRTSVARTVCGLVGPFSTRVDGTAELNPLGLGPGRGDLHPCPPEGQQ